jgi:hypothetical protein
MMDGRHATTQTSWQGTANAITSTARRPSAVESAVELESGREKRQKA